MTAAKLDVAVHRLAHGADLPLPAYATAGAAGMDLIAAVDEPLNVPPLGRVGVPTGLAIALPPGFEAQIRPRSGLALRHGITVLNSPGTIDADYRGEIVVLLINLGGEPVRIERGMRIAQMVIAPVVTARWQEGGALSATVRGEGGFGSTGTAGAGVRGVLR